MALEDTLLQRQMQNQRAEGNYTDPVQAGLVSPPPEPKDRLPTAFDRWLMAEKMKAGYRNGWNPNPILTKAMG